VSERFEVPLALDGERLDRALALLTGRSRGELAQVIATGDVRIGDAVVTVRHRRVEAGEALAIELPPPIAERLAPTGNADVAFVVCYEDEAIVVIDKPPGLVVHPGAGHHDDTLVSGLLARYPDLVAEASRGAFDPTRPGIVHRLDKDTSGLLVVARTADAYRSLRAQLDRRAISRDYVALALGTLAADEGLIDAPIGRSGRDPTRMAVRTEGRAARTRYRVTERFVEPVALSLVDVSLDTGRTHQIRVHLAAIGHPVAGDTRYRGSVRELGLTRPFLHAARLGFVHPTTGAELTFAAPLPEDLRAVLERLRAT
jgi:23S rRNA pseudouridine1911/1915/1917 synthase